MGLLYHYIHGHIQIGRHRHTYRLALFLRFSLTHTQLKNDNIKCLFLKKCNYIWTNFMHLVLIYLSFRYYLGFNEIWNITKMNKNKADRERWLSLFENWHCIYYRHLNHILTSSLSVLLIAAMGHVAFSKFTVE